VVEDEEEDEGDEEEGTWCRRGRFMINTDCCEKDAGWPGRRTTTSVERKTSWVDGHEYNGLGWYM
jgi:hypothetical protein